MDETPMEHRKKAAGWNLSPFGPKHRLMTGFQSAKLYSILLNPCFVRVSSVAQLHGSG
jgi:hypothetical protein